MLKPEINWCDFEKLDIRNFPKKQIDNFFSECLVLGVIGGKQEVTILTTTAPTANGLPIG